MTEKKQNQRPAKKIEKVEEISNYYGFSARKNIEIKKIDLDNAKNLMVGDYINPDIENESLRLPLHVEEKVSILRTYFEEKWNETPQPVQVFIKGNFKGHINKKAEKFNRFIDLEIVGTNKSIAEATLIQTASVILKEAGYDDFYVDINSIGDKESINHFNRDLITYYRKNLSEICSECRQLMKKDVFEVLSCNKEHCKKINLGAPKSMAYLSDASRNHFREVLEFLESLGIPFKINEHLLGNKQYCTETIYEIINQLKDKKETLAVGVRYDGLSKKIGLKKDISAAGISIIAKIPKDSELTKEVKINQSPLVYFMQLGFEAKLLSLKIIEILRQSKIPVYQALSRDKLTSQMGSVEKMKIPFTIIVGKKEAVDNSAIVKKMSNHSQQTVKLEELGEYMKKVIKEL